MDTGISAGELRLMSSESVAAASGHPGAPSWMGPAVI
jgi:hypothetical protein